MYLDFRSYILLLLLAVVNSSCTEVSCRWPTVSENAEVSKHIRFLSSDELRGRLTGSQSAKVAARYIAENFRSYGLKSFTAYPDYLQSFSGWFENNSDSFHCNNVVGYIEGTDTILKNEFIVLVAHYDHLGVKKDNPNTTIDSIYNGARDNGIGVSALLYSAHILSKRTTRRSVIILATSGEEPGMLGSKYFVENCPINLEDISFVLNNDGGGFNDTSLIRIAGLDLVNYPTQLSAYIQDNYQVVTMKYPDELDYLYRRGDNISFVRKGIPSITISPGFDKIDENIVKYVHKTCDEVDDDFNLNYLYKYCQIYADISDFFSNSIQVPDWAE